MITIQNGDWVDVVEGSFPLIDQNIGIYIPRQFAKVWGEKSDLSKEDLEVLLAGPDHLDYFDTWNSVVDTLTFEFDGAKYGVFEDCDLWAYPKN